MSTPAPIDPKADAERRDRAAAGLRDYHLTLVVFATQCVLSLVVGAWAASVADDGSGTIGLYAGVATAFAFAGAVGAAYSFKTTAGTILALFGLPAFIKRVTASRPPPPGPPDPREQRREFLLHGLTTGVHASVLLVLFLLVAAAVAFYGPVGFGELAVRFALASGLLSLLTWRGLKIFS